MKQAFLYAVLLLIGVNSDAVTILGVDNSGGGKAVVCRDAQNNIKRIQLLDLFEGESIYGLTAKSFGESQEENLQGAKEILDATFAQMHDVVPIAHFIDQALKDFRLLPPDVKLAPVDDAAPIVIPVGCELEQLAYYQNNQNLLVDQNLWNALDGKNRAALIIHEVIYQQARFEGDQNSRNARRAVAHIFSNYTWTPVMDGIVSTDAYCWAKKDGDSSAPFIFYRKETMDPINTFFQFKRIRGHLPFTKTTIGTMAFPWSGGIGGTYSKVSDSNFEGLNPIIVSREVGEMGHERYYFSEPDGKYFIQCNDKE